MPPALRSSTRERPSWLPPTPPHAPTLPLSTVDRGPERVSTETKASFKTTELVFYILAVAGVLIASNTISADDGQGGDLFRADRAWLYVTLLTIGYMISRGFAKSGSREPYDR